MDKGKKELTLVGHAAFRSFRNLWMLEELGIPYDYVPAKPRSEAAKSANPFGKVPALVDGDFTMYESAAINTYLADRRRARDPPTRPGWQEVLVPEAGTKARGRYEHLVSCLQTEMDAQCLWVHRKHEAMGQVFGAIPGAVAHAKQYFSVVLGVLLRHLKDSGGDFLLGSEFSAADILFVHCMDWAGSIGWLEDATMTNDQRSALRLYLDLCRSRPPYLRVALMRSTSHL